MPKFLIPLTTKSSQEDIQRAELFIKDFQELITIYRIGICTLDNTLHLINTDSGVLIKKFTYEGWCDI